MPTSLSGFQRKLREKLFHFLHLDLRKQFRIHVIHVQFLCHRVAHALPVPGEHDDLTDAFLLHFLQCPFGIGLYFIPDIKGTQIAASLCHIHGGGRIGSGRSRDPQFFHHTGISHGEDTFPLSGHVRSGS